MFYDEDEPIPIEPDESARALFAAPGEFILTEDEELELILGEALDGTVVSCGQCGEAYLLAEEIADERLLHACPDCVDKI